MGMAAQDLHTRRFADSNRGNLICTYGSSGNGVVSGREKEHHAGWRDTVDTEQRLWIEGL